MTSAEQPARWRALVAAIAAAALLTACSAAEMAYRNADWLALKRLDSYLDLESEQRTTLAANLEARLEHHRTEELPALVRGLTKARDMVSEGLSERGALELATFAHQLYVDTARGVVRDVAPILVTLDAGQIDHLQDRFAAESAKFRERRLADTHEERLERRLRRTTDRLEKWIGPLDDGQLALVRTTLPAIPSLSESWLAFNEEQQLALLALLRAGAPLEQVVSRLDAWWIDEQRRPPEYRERMQLAVEQWITLAVRLDESLDEGQRQRATDRLDGYLRALSKLAPPAANA